MPPPGAEGGGWVEASPSVQSLPTTSLFEGAVPALVAENPTPDYCNRAVAFFAVNWELAWFRDLAALRRLGDEIAVPRNATEDVQLRHMP